MHCQAERAVTYWNELHHEHARRPLRIAILLQNRILQVWTDRLHKIAKKPPAIRNYHSTEPLMSWTHSNLHAIKASYMQ